MVFAFSVCDDQVRKLEFAEISERLRGLARDVSSLSETQPDFSEHMRDTHKELKSIIYRLRELK